MSTMLPGDAHTPVVGTPDVSQRSFGELMGNVTRDLSTLVRQEIELAKAETRQEATQAGKAAGLYAGAGIGAHMVLLFLSIALWWGLSNVMDGGWAGLIVAAVWAVVAAALYVAARGQMAKVRALPMTTETVKKIPEAIKPERGNHR